MTQVQSPADPEILILLAVLLPPSALDVLGTLVRETRIETPYGVVGPLALRQLPDGPAVWVEPYTGLPTRTDPRATVLAARTLGVRRILNWDDGIGLNRLLQRGQPVVPGDFIDWTRHQPDTLLVGERQRSRWEEAPRSPRFCPQMRETLCRHIPVAPEVTYLGLDGPRRESPAEARMFRRLGADVAGHNLVPEVALAGEAGLCYGGLVTVGHLSSDQSIPRVDGEVRHSLEVTIAAVPGILRELAAEPGCECQRNQE